MVSRKMKMKKIIRIKPAKKKACDAFSLYIRTRDALKTTKDVIFGLCVTCGQRYPVRSRGGLQCGHFIQGRHPSILFDERNAHAQCYGCNVMKKGNMVVYYEFMLKTYGKKVIDELKLLDKNTMPMKVYMYLEIAETYKQKWLDYLASFSG